MKWPLTSRISSLKALGVFFVLGAATHAGVPYLRQIGPPPLRMDTVKGPAMNVLRFKANSTATTNSGMAAISASTNSVTSLNPAWETNSVISSTPPLFVPATPAQSLGDAFTAPIFTLPTPDLLGISPEMLATYFRPVTPGTNSADPLRVFFTPPLPPLLLPVVPDKSSHAEYIVK